MSDKPSRNEEEYFAKREAELLKAGRAKADHDAQDAERRTHFMRCPRCGANLKQEEYHAITVERCPECQGVWFDAHEAEALMRHESTGLGSIFAALVRGVRSSGATHKPA